MSKKEILLRQKEQKARHPAGQIFLDRADLYEFFLVSKFGNPNWCPGQTIQVGDFNLAQNHLAKEALDYLGQTDRYRYIREGHQTNLKPNEVDETVKAAIKLGGIKSLMPLIGVFCEFPEIISSATILPNSSLGIKNNDTVSYGSKINGVILEIDSKDGRLKPRIAQLATKMRWPFGRTISVLGLQGIDIDSFVDHFGEGDDLKTSFKQNRIKFLDFYFDCDGAVYSVFSAGGLKNLSSDFFSGTQRQVSQRFSYLLEDQTDLHQQIASGIVSNMGHGVSYEKITSSPYVGMSFSDSRSSLSLVSGANLFPGLIFFNRGPESPGILSSFEDPLQPIGINPKSLVVGSIGRITVPNGQILTPVKMFGLS